MNAESTKESLGAEHRGNQTEASVMGGVCARAVQILLSVFLKYIELQMKYSY